MGRHSWLFAVLPLGTAACAQIAGIDPTTGLVPAERVSLTITRLSIGATVVRTPQDLTGFEATYLVPDDTQPDGLSRVAAEHFPDLNVWSAELANPAPIQFDLPDYPTPLRRIWDFPNRNVATLFGVNEHPNPEPAPAMAMLTVQAMLPSAYAANESLSFYNVGTWNTRSFTGAELPLVGATALGPVTFAYTSTAKYNNRPHEKITTADQPLVLRHIGPRLTGVLEATPFDQAATNTIMGAMTAVTNDQTLAIQLQPAMVAGRYAPLRPAMANVTMAWGLNASPGYEVGNTSGPGLHGGSVAAMDTGTLTQAYGNPFVARGWNTVFTWSTVANRAYTPVGQTLPATLNAGLYQLVEPTGNMTLDLPAGIPQLVTLGTTPLASDGLTIPQPTTPITASFVTGNPDNTLYQLELYELVPNMANTALEYKRVIGILGTKPEAAFPPEVFAPGKYYTLRAVTQKGSYPNLADGDLTVRQLPLAVAYFDSGVFTVTP